MRPKILIGTRSAGKQAEIRTILAEVPYDFVFPDDIGLYETPVEANIETESSFEGNALRKAEYFSRLSHLPTAAEDSGLEVLSLGGLPGVRSRRFSLATHNQDEANNEELLRRLAGAPPDRRGARYQSVVAFLATPSAVPQIFTGMCAGRILDAPRGHRGFGYDPLFYSEELGCTFGEADALDKHRVSHRGRSLRALVEWLNAHPL